MTIYPTPRRNIQESKYLCISESHLQAHYKVIYRLTTFLYGATEFLIRATSVMNSGVGKAYFFDSSDILAKLKNNILFLYSTNQRFTLRVSVENSTPTFTICLLSVWKGTAYPLS